MNNKKMINNSIKMNKILKDILHSNCLGSIIYPTDTKDFDEIIVADYSENNFAYVYINEKEREFDISSTIDSNFNSYTLLRIFQVFSSNGYKFRNKM